MARCHRCNACESMWDCSPCDHCGFPDDDTRTTEVKAEDDEDMEEFYSDEL